METVDTLISARWVIPIEPAARVLEHHTVAVRQGRIINLLPTAVASGRYEARDRVDRPSHVLLPGFGNAHASASLALLRGRSIIGNARDSRAPAAATPDPDWLDEDFVRDGTELAAARMIASGTTCFADTHRYPGVVARTAAAIQVRACVGLPLLERPTSWATTTDEYFEKASELRDTWRDDPLISTVFATDPTLPDETLQRLRRASDEIELPICMPLHESLGELQIATTRHGSRPLERLERLGFATPLLIGLHLTQLNATDIGILARSGIHAVACSRFNLQRRAGICPVADLQAQGVNLALGTGGAAGADLQGELRLAALLATGHEGQAVGVSVHDVLRMATLGGARALGLADSIGSIVPGKWADLCCIDLAVLQTQPLYDLPEQLVHAAEQDQVTDVWVAGRTLLGSGNLVRADLAATVERASRWYS